jgi:hypothetical protein
VVSSAEFGVQTPDIRATNELPEPHEYAAKCAPESARNIAPYLASVGASLWACSDGAMHAYGTQIKRFSCGPQRFA